MPLTDAQRAANKRYDDAHTRYCTIKLPIDEADELTEYCKANGISRNGFVRSVVLEAVRSGVVPADVRKVD